MTKEEALKFAAEMVITTNKTACVFKRVTHRKGKEEIDYRHGSAHEKGPKGYKPALWVSVTGLVREVNV
jgi:hypothetical protein